MKLLEMDVPEYFVNRIGRVEKVGGNCVRLTMCVQFGEVLEPRYTCIWPVECLLSRSDLLALAGREVLDELTTH